MTRERLRLAGLLVAAAFLTTGCSVLQLPFFLMRGEPKIDAMLVPLAEKGEAKILILTAAPPSIDTDFIRIENELTSKVVMHLKRLCEENKEEITFVSSSKVDKFKDEHPNWATDLDLVEIGKKFEADYVVYLDIETISMYEKGTGSYMYRGRSEIAVQVHAVKDEDAEPIYETVTIEYPPSDLGAVASDEARPADFRQRFLDHMARKVAYLFTAHTTREEFRMDRGH
jgi:hypothetical protein